MNPHQLVHPLDQRRFVVANLCLVSLGGSRLPDHTARLPLRDLEALFELLYGPPPASRAHHSPLATSLSIATSRACSATSFLSRRSPVPAL
jgi:hypothetical protein